MAMSTGSSATENATSTAVAAAKKEEDKKSSEDETSSRPSKKNFMLSANVNMTSAIAKMKAASHQKTTASRPSGPLDKRAEFALNKRAEFARDTRRLSAYLGGMGLAEIQEIEGSTRNLNVGVSTRNLNVGQNSRTLELMAQKSSRLNNGMIARPGDGGTMSAEERYGPFPLSDPIPTNPTPVDIVVRDERFPKPWDTATHNGPDERDLGTPDEWIARHGESIRLTGRHPYNASPPVPALMEAGFLTPGHLHFTRNHGAVPRLDWDNHKIEIKVHAAKSTSTADGSNGLVLQMADLTACPDVKDLPVSMTCIGNRRSEFNAIRHTVGFSFGIATTATSVFRGVPLRTMLLRAGVSENEADWAGCHVEFVGADSLPNKLVGDGPFDDEPWGKKSNYGTSVPLGKAMDPARDMMLAFEANGEPIPPDHGYPCRVIVPGSTAARSVKWLARINVLPHMSHNLYHHHDNKILPPHVLDLESSLDPEKKWWYQNEYIVHGEFVKVCLARTIANIFVPFQLVLNCMYIA